LTILLQPPEPALDFPGNGPTVVVEAPGEHGFDMPKLKNADLLIRYALIRAGYTRELLWRATIAKQLHCSPQTPPLRVVAYKPWGVVLKVKPYDHDTSHHVVNLAVPDGSGYRAESAFKQLQGIEKKVQPGWLNQARNIKTPTRPPEEPKMNAPAVVAVPVPVAPVKPPTNGHHTNGVHKEPHVNRLTVAPEQPVKPPQQAYVLGKPDKPELNNLQRIDFDNKKFAWVAWATEETNKLGLRIESQWKEEFRKIAEFMRFSRNAVGQMFRSLVEEGLVIETATERGRIIGFTLTDKGRTIYHFACPKTPAEPPKPPDPGKVMLAAVSSVRALEAGLSSLERNRKRREELLRQKDLLDLEIRKLDEEYCGLSHTLASGGSGHLGLIEQLSKTKFQVPEVLLEEKNSA
jgi:DNA-binding MarR family transcriptional regulator